MRVDLYPADEGACGKLRLVWPGEAARRAGYDVRIHPKGPQPDFPVKVWHDIAARKRVARVLEEARELEVVVFQRPLNWRVPLIIMALQQIGVRCVVEIDDDLGTVDRRHAMWRSLQPSNPESGAQFLAEACRLADAVVVTTPRLAQRYGPRHAVVVENHIPASYLDTPRDTERGRFVIGWTGRVPTHPGDLEVTRGAVQRALTATGGVFRVIATDEGVRAAAGLSEPPEALNGVLLADYPATIAHFDAGIAPLARSAFNESKSWLKPLDYAACGVPFVCSATTEYRRFTDMGCGLVAESRHDWEKQLVRLHRSATLRDEQSQAGREVAAKLTIEAHFERFVEAWCGLLPIPDVAAARDTDAPMIEGSSDGDVGATTSAVAS